MKLKLLIIATLLFCSKVLAQESSDVILKNAYAKAKKEDKNVFVIFHASWCSWCKKMDQQMNDESCKSLFDKNYVIEHLTVLESEKNKQLENPGAFELLKQYKAEKSGIPFFLIFDKNENLLEDSFDNKGQNLGCPVSKEEVDEFVRILKTTSKLNDKELEIICNKFVKK